MTAAEGVGGVGNSGSKVTKAPPTGEHPGDAPVGVGAATRGVDQERDRAQRGRTRPTPHAQHWEVRKVEIFSDGHSDWADKTRSKGTSMLSEKRMPSIAEIAEQPEFSPEQITSSEFEEIWQQSTTDGA